MITSPKRNPKSHKGDNGRVLIIGGSEKYPGAIALSSLAVSSLRTGTDLVTVAAPEKVAFAINSLIPDVITVKLKGNYLKTSHIKILESYIAKSDVVLIGPGLSLNNETKNAVNKLMKSKAFNGKLKVIDADALKIIRLQNVKNAILTPHHGEFKILLKNSGLTEKNFRANLGNNVILLKGPADEIISKTKIVKNKNGNSGMTVGGTGDVLAGICAGLLSQRLSLFDAAHTSAFLMGRVGDKLYKKIGYGFIASDFLAEISEELKKISK